MVKGRTSSLIVRMPFPAKAVDNSAQPSRKKSRSTLWREKLKRENPDIYGDLKKVDRQRKKREYHRELLDESRTTRFKRKLKQEKKATQQRQRRRKQRLVKQSETTTKGLSTSITTNDDKNNEITKKERRNQYMKEYMCKKRASMSRQKKQAVKEKDKQRKTLATKKQSGTGTSSNGSMKERKRKECQPCLPDTPERFADVIGSVLDTSTLKKIKALEERGIPATEEGRKRFSLMNRFGEETTEKLSESCKKKKKTSASKKVQRSLDQTIANIFPKKYGYANGNAKGGKEHSWKSAS